MSYNIDWVHHESTTTKNPEPFFRNEIKDYPPYLDRPKPSAEEKSCKYCQKGTRLEDEYANYEAEVVKIMPLPAIDLTTGEKADTADPPYYAMLVYEDPDGGENASFPINFCPMCGRDLRSEN